MIDKNSIERLSKRLEYIDNELIVSAIEQNEWFSEKSIRRAVRGVVDEFLDWQKLSNWLCEYGDLSQPARLTTMVVTAGNIPLVGFFDLFCSVLVGERTLLKPSSRDRVLMSFVAKLMNEELNAKIDIVDSIDNSADVLLFMGSDAVADELMKTWSNKPHLIRSHRTSVALLSGEESSEQLEALVDDVFAYFGLGCRNVTNIFIPRGYDLNRLIDVFNRYEIDSPEYQRIVKRHVARLSVCEAEFCAGNFFVMNEGFSSELPMGELRWIEYDRVDELECFINDNESVIQCVVNEFVPMSAWKCIPFGRAQQPSLNDFPDRVDTIQFLQKIVTFAKQ